MVSTTMEPASSTSLERDARLINAREHRIKFRLLGLILPRRILPGQMEPNEPDCRIGFIHRAIGFDAQVEFRNAAAIPEAGRAVIPGFCVDSIELDHAQILAR